MVVLSEAASSRIASSEGASRPALLPFPGVHLGVRGRLPSFARTAGDHDRADGVIRAAPALSPHQRRRQDCCFSWPAAQSGSSAVSRRQPGRGRSSNPSSSSSSLSLR
jgi:hypothetical protein